MAYQNNPYILAGQEDQQLQGIQPMMQNIAQQQATQQMALQQQLANNQAAGQMPNQGAGAGNMALAMALRKDKPKGKTVESDALKKEIEGLGSNTWNPYSDYNTGANGWGNYGE